MGHNIDLVQLINLPEETECPVCMETIPTYFEDYDIDCGNPNKEKGILNLDCYCSNCDVEFTIRVKIEYEMETRS